MSQVTAYTQLYPYLTPRLPGCAVNLILLTLKEVTRQFCEDTEAFRDDLDMAGIVDFQQDYDLTGLHAYDASLHRIRWATVNSTPWGDNQYELYQEKYLRFRSHAVPNNLDNQLLVCATAGTSTLTDWQAITDGSVTVSVDGSTYSLASLDFSGDGSLAEVAGTIQTALRDSLDGNTGYVRWAQDHFNVYNPGGVVSYLTAGASGTDISGAGYMNGLTGSGTLSGALLVNAVFRPDVNSDTLPSWFLDRWSSTLVAGTIAELAGRPKMPYSDEALAVKMLGRYRTGWSKARTDAKKEYTGRIDDLS